MPRVQDALPSLDCRGWKGRSNPLLLSALRFAPESRAYRTDLRLWQGIFIHHACTYRPAGSSSTNEVQPTMLYQNRRSGDLRGDESSWLDHGAPSRHDRYL